MQHTANQSTVNSKKNKKKLTANELTGGRFNPSNIPNAKRSGSLICMRAKLGVFYNDVIPDWFIQFSSNETLVVNDFVRQFAREVNISNEKAFDELNELYFRKTNAYRYASFSSFDQSVRNAIKKPNNVGVKGQNPELL